MLNITKTFLKNPRKILKLYSLGALLFFVGIGFIQGADKLISPSLEQEVYALLGTGIAGCGFMIAMLGQLLLIIHRFQKLGQRDQ